MRWIFGISASISILVVASGCSTDDVTVPPPPIVAEDPGNPAVNRLRGTILIDEKTPMPFGSILVYRTDSTASIACGEILDSSYSIDRLPIGEVRIVVTQYGKRNGTSPNLGPLSRSQDLEMMQRKRLKTTTSILQAKDPTKEKSSATTRSPTPNANPNPNSVSTQQLILLQKIERLYGSIAAPKVLSTLINEGENVYDIRLDSTNPPEAAIETPE